MRKLARLMLLLPLVLAACAAGDVPTTPTSPPPVTIPPPPTLTFGGNCDNTHELESWLQTTSMLLSDFQTQMNQAAAQNRGEASVTVVGLSKLRDSAYAVVAPDCAADLQLKMSDAMNKAVTALEQFANGGDADVGGTVAEVNTEIDSVSAAQKDLMKRMDTQYQNQVLTPSPPG